MAQKTNHIGDTNKMVTAVEWLYEQLTEVDYGCINKIFLQNNNTLAGHKLRELLEQAKQMEKEQSMDLIKQTAMFMGASNFDKEIALMTYEDVYNSYYKK